MTRDLYSCNLLAKLMVLNRKILFSLQLLAVHANISTDVVLTVGMILLFSVLTPIPCTVAFSTGLLVRSLSSPLLPPMKSMSSANRRLHIRAFHQWRCMCGGLECFLHDLLQEQVEQDG